jgi:hypothetical protein
VTDWQLGANRRQQLSERDGMMSGPRLLMLAGDFVEDYELASRRHALAPWKSAIRYDRATTAQIGSQSDDSNAPVASKKRSQKMTYDFGVWRKVSGARLMSKGKT